MTTTNLLRVGATVLFFTAACKGDFAAGITDNGDASAQEAGAQQDGGNPNAQEAGHPSSTGSVSCDPFQPTAKPITLTNVLGAGGDTDGTLYVVDQPQAGGERVFVLSGITLQRQRIAGSGTETAGGGVMLYSFTITDHVPPFMLKLETDASGPTAMGVLQDPPLDIRTFTIGQQGSVLTLVPASQVAALPVANIPAQTFIEYNATLPDGRALLVVRPRDDWTYPDFRVFFGAPNHMAERSVSQVVRYKDGGSTTINFTIDGVAAVASFPVQLSPGGLVIGPATLTIGGTQLPLTLEATDSPPAGNSYLCPGTPSPDSGACETSEDCIYSMYEYTVVSSADCYCFMCGSAASKSLAAEHQRQYEQVCGPTWQSDHACLALPCVPPPQIGCVVGMCQEIPGT
jgi:hypothetical protein